MRLHDFITSHVEQILVEWEAFARTCAPASTTMDVTALRDHAHQMLTVIAADLRTEQDAQEQSEKSKGQAPESRTTATTAAEAHGSGRAESGFTVEQMVAEYRALRASVIRLWTRQQGELRAADIEDLTRFNEAIDQSLAQSVSEFNENVQNAKEMFLAILGHDLRTPLGAIYTSAKFMLDSDELEEPHRSLTSRTASSALRTTQMVGDLLDFTRSRLGGGIPIVRAETDLASVLNEAADELRAAYPGSEVRVDAPAGGQIGEWDAARIGQALTNLIGNAVEHSLPGSPVTVELGGGDEDAVITIHNRGGVIPADQLDGIFNPMKMSMTPRKPSTHGPGGNLGLGLYIAERIAHAHGGRIEVASSEAEGTTFTVCLPRAG
jgi:signal transduction histidine kinase